jgi:hypothetical protein
MDVGFKLGDKVQFTAHYEKTHDYFDAEDEALWTDEQRECWENEAPVIIDRVKLVKHEPKAGFIAGKRNIVVQTGIAPYEDYEEGYGYCRGLGLKNTLQQVYLVAVNMAGFYRVHPEWIDPSEGGN